MMLGKNASLKSYGQDLLLIIRDVVTLTWGLGVGQIFLIVIIFGARNNKSHFKQSY